MYGIGLGKTLRWMLQGKPQGHFQCIFNRFVCTTFRLYMMDPLRLGNIKRNDSSSSDSSRPNRLSLSFFYLAFIWVLGFAFFLIYVCIPAFLWFSISELSDAVK